MIKLKIRYCTCTTRIQCKFHAECKGQEPCAPGISICENDEHLNVKLRWRNYKSKDKVHKSQNCIVCNRKSKFAICKSCDNSRRLRLCKKALEFYANPESYFAIAIVGDRPCGSFIDDFSETDTMGVRPGKLAREVLKL